MPRAPSGRDGSAPTSFARLKSDKNHRMKNKLCHENNRIMVKYGRSKNYDRRAQKGALIREDRREGLRAQAADFGLSQAL